MNLVKAWKAYKGSVAAGKAAKGYLKRAEKIVDDDAKVNDWKAYMILANACLSSQLKYQQEFDIAIGKGV